MLRDRGMGEEGKRGESEERDRDGHRESVREREIFE